MANHVPTQTATPSAPPHPLPSANPTPRWQQLTPELQQPLLALLTRMLQQHLSTACPDRAKGVADERR
jgi:hypothetical protein